MVHSKGTWKGSFYVTTNSNHDQSGRTNLLDFNTPIVSSAGKGLGANHRPPWYRIIELAVVASPLEIIGIESYEVVITFDNETRDRMTNIPSDNVILYPLYNIFDIHGVTNSLCIDTKSITFHIRIESFTVHRGW
jgi:hypothetical protein